MACECKDANGSLLAICMGTCKPSKIATEVNDIRLHLEEMVRKFTHTLSEAEFEIKDSFKELYLEGFRKGFEMAKEIYE